MLLLLTAFALTTTPSAHAGGDFVDLAVGGGHIWFVGPVGVQEIDVVTGRTVSAPQLSGAPYPQSVALAGGALWIAGVQNGDVAGTLSRIDLHTRKIATVWRIANGSVQYVAAGGGGIWALASSPTNTKIIRFEPDGNVSRVWRLPADDDGRMAADASGCWISTNTWLLHIDSEGRLRQVLRAPLGDISTAGGAVWLPRPASVLRIDERTGQVRILATGRLRLGGFQHDLAFGDNALWALQLRSTGKTGSTLERFDPENGRLTGSVRLTGIADAVVVRPGAVWVATVAGPAGEAATGYDLVRINPTNLRRTLLIHVT